MTNNLMAVKISDGKTYRYCVEETTGTYFVFAPRKRRLGWRYTPEEFDMYFVQKAAPDENEQWHSRIRTAMKKLNDSGLWPGLSDFLVTLLDLDWNDLKQMRKEYWNRKYNSKPYQSKWAEKYPFAYEENEEGTYLKWEYVEERADCRLKSMYFGRDNTWIKNNIKSSLDSRTDYRTLRIPCTYDVSFEYSADKNKAWYSEEYKNCGNGHYYIALDHNTALFLEDD